MKQKQFHRGFTLIELVIVITILSILAAVSIPAFQNLTDRARVAGVRGGIGGMRSAISVYRANEVAEGRALVYPSLNQMKDSVDNAATPKPMEGGDTPDNPWCIAQACSANRDDISVSGAASTTRTIISTAAVGWLYDVTTGLIYANTSAAPAAVGGPENLF